MFEGEKSWKMRSLGQKPKCGVAPSDKNSDRRGTEQMRGKTGMCHARCYMGCTDGCANMKKLLQITKQGWKSLEEAYRHCVDG